METAQLDRIEAKLDRLIGGPPKETITLHEAMALSGCHSETAFFRLRRRLGVLPFSKGKYRRAELENAIARMALQKRISQSKT